MTWVGKSATLVNMTPTTICPPRWRLQDRLQRSLDEADISSKDMAEQLFVSRSTLSNYLNGRTKPTATTLMAWASLTGVPFGWLTGEGQ